MSEIEQICELIKWHFGETDHYAVLDNCVNCDGYFAFKDDDGSVIAYILYEFDGLVYHGVRSGVVRAHRGKKLSLKLYKKMIQFAKKKGKPYQTYTSKQNVESINAHVRAGMRIIRISDFVYLST